MLCGLPVELRIVNHARADEKLQGGGASGGSGRLGVVCEHSIGMKRSR